MTQAQSPQPLPARTDVSRPSRILVVGDLAGELRALESIFADLGEPLLRARSAPEALGWLQGHECALVLLEAPGSEPDGLEVAAQIRRRPEYRNVPLLFFSASLPLPSVIERAYDLGAADFFSPPFCPKALRAKLEVFLELHRSRSELAWRVAERTADLNSEIVERRRTEMALRVALRSKEDILNSIPTTFIVLDRDFRFRYVNPAGVALMHRSQDELLGRTVWEVFPEAEGNVAYQELHRALREGIPVHFVESNYERDRWYENRVFPSADGLTLLVQDITEKRQAEEAIRASDERLRRIAEQVPCTVWTTDTELVITSSLGAGLAQLGLKPGQLVGIRLEAFVGEDHIAVEAHRRVLREGVAMRYEGLYQGRAHEARIEPLRDPQGKVVGLIGVSYDRTERKEAEEQLAKELLAVKRLNSVDQICSRPAVPYAEALGEILDAAIALAGSDKGTLQIYDPTSGSLSVAAQRGFEERFLKYFETVDANTRTSCGCALAEERLVIVEDVEQSPIFAGQKTLGLILEAGVRAVQTTPLLSSTGAILGVISTHFERPHRFHDRELGWIALLARQGADYIERRLSEEALRASEEGERGRAEELEAVMESVPAAILMTKDREARVIVGNQRANEIFHMAPGANLSKRPLLGSPPDCYDLFIDGRKLQGDELPIQTAARTGVPILAREFEVRYPEGPSRWIYGNAVPLFDAQGRVRQVVAAFVDVTERRQAEEALRASEERERGRAEELHALMESAPAGILITKDREGSVIVGNSRAYEILRMTPGQNISQSAPKGEPPLPFELYLDGRRIPAAELPIQKSAATGLPVIGSELEIRFHDGTSRFIHNNAVPLFDRDGKVRQVVGTFIDLTERRQAEEALRASEERERGRAEELHAVMESVPAGIVMTKDRDGNVIVGNSRAYEMLRMTPGQNISKSAPEGDPPAPYELYLDGRLVPPEELPVQKAAATGLPVFGREFELRLAEGPSRWIHINAVPLFDRDGRVKQVVAAFIDVTERRQSEEVIRRLNSTLEEKVKARTAELSRMVTELEMFSYTIAHDLRAPLRTMRGFSEVLLEDFRAQLGPEGQDVARRIVDGAQRMDDLTSDLLAYCRVAQAPAGPENLDLDSIAAEVLESFDAEIRHRSASVELSQPLGRARGNPLLMRQALGNLVSNALKFTRAGEKPQVGIGTDRTGRRITLWVRDRGIGVEIRHQPKLFGMFERLEPGRFPGTGIGLAIVRKAAERMGGLAGMESEPGKGSKFWIELPAAEPVP